MRFWQPHAAQLHIYHTIRGLQNAGHDVSLLALQEREVLWTGDLGVFSRSTLDASHYAAPGLSGTAPFKRFESAVRRLQRELRLPYLALFDSYRMFEAARRKLGGFDLMHERFNLLALGGALAGRRLGIPLVLEVNADLFEQRKFKGVPERGMRRLFARWATAFCFGAAAKIICISTDLRNHLHTKWNVDDSRLAVVPCAADVHAFAREYDSAAVRRRYSLTTEPVVMWVGGFYPWHDLQLLLDSFAIVLQQCPDARLILVGDGQTRLAVARQVMDSGLEQAVLMTGAITHEDVPQMLSIADIAVVPSAPLPAGQGGTGAPLKLFEYMAAGKAIVATALDQAAEVVLDGETGLFVSPGDAHAFAAAILALLADPERRQRLGCSARRQAVAHHSWEQYTRQLEAIYADVLA